MGRSKDGTCFQDLPGLFCYYGTDVLGESSLGTRSGQIVEHATMTRGLIGNGHDIAQHSCAIVIAIHISQL